MWVRAGLVLLTWWFIKPVVVYFTFQELPRQWWSPLVLIFLSIWRKSSLWLDCIDCCISCKYYLIKSSLIILFQVCFFFNFPQLQITKQRSINLELILFDNKLQWSGMPQTHEQVELGRRVHQSNSIFHSAAPCSSLYHLHKCCPPLLC